MNQAALIDKISERLSKKRLEHTLMVKKEALKLAERYHCNKEDAALAAILHDMCRDYSLEELNTYVKAYKLEDFYLNNKALAHAKVAAKCIPKVYGINDRNIIDAVAFHTTARADMTLLEKIIYLADCIEPNRQYKGIQELRELAYKDIDEACLVALDASIIFVINKKGYLHIDTLLARNYLLTNKRRYR